MDVQTVLAVIQKQITKHTVYEQTVQFAKLKLLIRMSSQVQGRPCTYSALHTLDNSNLWFSFSLMNFFFLFVFWPKEMENICTLVALHQHE